MLIGLWATCVVGLFTLVDVVDCVWVVGGCLVQVACLGCLLWLWFVCLWFG